MSNENLSEKLSSKEAEGDTFNGLASLLLEAWVRLLNAGFRSTQG